MNPVLKYFVARLGIFAAIAAPLMFFTNLHWVLALAIGLLASLIASFWLLGGAREEMIDHIDSSMKKRREEKEKLRAELNGE